MHAISTWLKHTARKLPMLPLLAAIGVLLLARNLGTYPAIFADEYYYNLFTRLTPRAEAWLPSYLYYAVFGVSSACGDGFLECVRLLNVLLLLAAAPFIYLLARTVMPLNRARIVTLLAMLAPFNVFTEYFMPEVSYYLAFWIFTWLLFRFVASGALGHLAGAGVVLGLAALIKVHALFLLLPFALFLVYLAFAQRGPDGRHWLVNALLYLAVGLASAAVVRYGLGYLLAGEASTHLLGPFYGSQSANRRPLSALLMPATQVFGAHLVAWAFLFALPVAAVLQYGITRAARAEAGKTVQALTVYTVLMLGAMLGVTALFSASIVGNGPAESLHRLHMRYYDFMFPLLLIVAGVQLSATATAGKGWRAIIALGLGTLLIYARITLMDQHMPNIVDAPELWSLKHVALQNLVTALGIIALASWVHAPRQGARVFLYVAAPLTVLAASAALMLAIRFNSNADPYAEAGMFGRDYLSATELDNLTIVGSDHGAVYRTKYHLDHAKANMLVVPDGAPFQLGQLGKQKQFALVIGQHPPPPGAVAHLTRRNFTLYTFARLDELVLGVDFSRPDLGLLAATGLSGPEPFGRWTDGARVVFQARQALPRLLRLRISARAVASNIGAPVKVTVGKETRDIRFAEGISDTTLDFDNDGYADTIILEVPHPVLASSVGPNPADTRQIGLALETMEIARRTANAAAPALP